MPANVIKIEYQRDGRTYSGMISRPIDAPDTSEQVLHFTGWEFRQIVRELHLWMVSSPSAGMTWIRRDIPPHTPYPLEEWLVHLIHVDPVRAIRAMSPAPMVINLKDEATSVAPVERNQIKVGHDTLAEAFGDWVYVDYVPAHQAVSCLCCGRNATILDKSSVEATVYAACDRCGTHFWLAATDSPRWLRIPTDTLLQLNWARYFIPRGWNPYGQWISAAELAAMYTAFKKERTECFQTAEA